MKELGAREATLRGAFRTAVGLSRTHGLAAARYTAMGVFMVIMLFLGFSQQVRPPSSQGGWSDVYRYQCFAVAFWSGERGFRDLPPTQCQAVVDTLAYNQQTIPQSHYLPPLVQRWLLDHSALVARFHTLPLEYPIVSLVPFSLPLLAPHGDYTLAFAVEMLLLALVVYALLARLAGWYAAAAFAFFMALGAYATGADRFDLVPAALTFGALVLAERRRWTWAYVLLALATMSKFYPAVLVIPLALAQLKALAPAQRSWRRLTGLGWYIAICAVLLAVSIAINPIGTYRQISMLGHRPFEVESIPATLAWLASWAHIPMQSFVYFGSDNVSSPLSSLFTLLMSVSLLAGLAVASLWLWRGRLSLREAWLAVLLLIVVTGKIFSAQYLIWVFPIAAYTLQLSGITPLIWMAVCALTTYSYPFLWRALGSWHATIALRNALVVVLAVMALRLLPQPGSPDEKASARLEHNRAASEAPPPSNGLHRPLSNGIRDQDSTPVATGAPR